MAVQTALDASRYACGLGSDRCDARGPGCATAQRVENRGRMQRAPGAAVAIASGRTGQGGGEEVAIDVAPGLDEGDSATSHLSLFLQESR